MSQVKVRQLEKTSTPHQFNQVGFEYDGKQLFENEPLSHRSLSQEIVFQQKSQAILNFK
jgi:hypothetical protein